MAAACRVREEVVQGKTLRFTATGIAETNAVVCAVLPAAPKAVSVGGRPLEASAYEFADGILRLRFPNSIDGVKVEVEW